MKPDICKFLVDEGADVDFLEKDRLNDSKLSAFGSTRKSMNVLLISLAYPGIM